MCILPFYWLPVSCLQRGTTEQADLSGCLGGSHAVRALWKLSSPVENSSCITRASHPKTGTQKKFFWKDTASPVIPSLCSGQTSAGGRVEAPTRAERSTLTQDSQMNPSFGQGGVHWSETLCSHWPRGRLLVQTKQMGGIWSL